MCPSPIGRGRCGGRTAPDFARVERVESDASGRATGVVYVDVMSGERFLQEAKVVMLAANGVGTPRLMLLSESAGYPNGLANGSDLVGRHLMHHGSRSSKLGG